MPFGIGRRDGLPTNYEVPSRAMESVEFEIVGNEVVQTGSRFEKRFDVPAETVFEAAHNLDVLAEAAASEVTRDSLMAYADELYAQAAGKIASTVLPHEVQG